MQDDPQMDAWLEAKVRAWRLERVTKYLARRRAWRNRR